MELYLAVLLGVVIYLLLQLNETVKAPEFNWKTWIKGIIIPTLLSIVTGCSFVWLKEDLVNIYPITPISALFLGVSGQAIFKKISGIFDKKVDTVVGL
jgi:hypothetical protein